MIEAKKLKNVRFELVEVTPAKAVEWLKKISKRQRLLHRNDVNRYVADMLAGRFTFSPDAIAFDEKDDLFNGMHRLTACVESGVSFWAIVMRGFPEDCMVVTDIGRKRDVADQLTTLNIELKKEPKIAAIMSTVYGYVYRFATRSSSFSLPYGTAQRAENINEDGLLLAAARFAAQYKNTRSKPSQIQVATAGTFYYLARSARHSEATITRFVESVAYGYGMTPNAAVDRTRARLSRIKHNSTPDIISRVGAVVSGFNHYVDNPEAVIGRFVSQDFPDMTGLNLETIKKKIKVPVNDTQVSVHSNGL